MHHAFFDDPTVDAAAKIAAAVGEGVVPLYEYLDALPDGIPLSVEAQIPAGNVYTGAEWAKISVERIRRFLRGYYVSRKA